MAAFNRLTVDLTPEILTARMLPFTVRVRRFAERALTDVSSRRFTIIDSDDAIVLVPHEDGGVEIEVSEGLTLAGDRLMFWALREPASPRHRRTEDVVEVSDGSASLLRHIASRADPFTLRRILAVAPEAALPVDSSRAGRQPAARKRWRTLLQEVLTILVDVDVRGLAALAGAQAFLEERKTGLAIADRDWEMVPVNELLELNDLQGQRRALERVLSGASESFGADIVPKELDRLHTLVERRRDRGRS